MVCAFVALVGIGPTSADPGNNLALMVALNYTMNCCTDLPLTMVILHPLRIHLHHPNSKSPQKTKAERSNVMLANHKSDVLLQVVPVTLYGPGNQLDTYPLLDPGSTCSLVTSDIAGQLGLDGPSESLRLFGIQATSHIETKRVSFDIGPVGVLASRYPVENALVAKRLNLPAVTVDTGKAKSQCRHLQTSS